MISLFITKALSIYITLIVLLVVLVAALCFMLYLGYIKKIYSKIFKRPAPMPKVDRSPNKLDQSTIYGRGRNWFYTSRNEYINVRIDSFDKTKLSGYYRPSRDRSTRFAVLLMHGYNEHPTEMAAYARLLMRQIECHVLIAHERAHLMSGGSNCTFGVYESVDATRWIDFLKQQIGPDVKIFIVGRGMGAVASLLAAEQPSLQSGIAGIIADSPFDSFENLLLSEGRKRYNMDLKFPIRTIDKLMSKNLKFDLSKLNCAENANLIRVPVLMVAGGEDDICTPEAVRKIYDNIFVPKRLVVIDHSKHLMCYNDAPSTYEKEVRKFVEECVFRLVSRGEM